MIKPILIFEGINKSSYMDTLKKLSYHKDNGRDNFYIRLYNKSSNRYFKFLSFSIAKYSDSKMSTDFYLDVKSVIRINSNELISSKNSEIHYWCNGLKVNKETFFSILSKNYPDYFAWFLFNLSGI